MQTDRQPPPIEEVVQRLAARMNLNTLRVSRETIPPHANCRDCRARSERSRRRCHLPAEPKPRQPAPRDTGAYVPEMAARIEDDRNLTDGARRCARKITEYVYRRDRENRQAEITVTYLMRALGRSRRTVQRYVRQLERAGYISVEVIPAGTRMCAGLIVEPLAPLLPRHHRARWPPKLIEPDAPRIMGAALMPLPNQDYSGRLSNGRRFTALDAQHSEETMTPK